MPPEKKTRGLPWFNPPAGLDFDSLKKFDAACMNTLRRDLKDEKFLRPIQDFEKTLAEAAGSPVGDDHNAVLVEEIAPGIRSKESCVAGRIEVSN